jgi:Clostripain family
LGLEEDTGSIDTLGKFVGAAVAAAPAEHYMLVIRGHGMDWKGVSPDKSSDSQITPKQASNSAAWIRALLGRPLDVRVLDVCVSQTAETAAELKESVNYLVATQTSQRGWIDLSSAFDAIGSNTPDADASPEYIARSLIQQATDTATFSLFDLCKFANVEEALSKFVSQACSLSEIELDQLHAALQMSKHFEFGHRDLSDFMFWVDDAFEQSLPTFSSSASAVQTALSDLVN